MTVQWRRDKEWRHYYVAIMVINTNFPLTHSLCHKVQKFSRDHRPSTLRLVCLQIQILQLSSRTIKCRQRRCQLLTSRDSFVLTVSGATRCSLSSHSPSSPHFSSRSRTTLTTSSSSTQTWRRTEPSGDRATPAAQPPPLLCCLEWEQFYYLQVTQQSSG